MTQLDSELRAVFGAIISRTPELGPVPTAASTHVLMASPSSSSSSSSSQSPSPSTPGRHSSPARSRWMLPAAAAVALVAIGGVFLIRQRSNSPDPGLVATSETSAPATSAPPTDLPTASSTAPPTPATVPATPSPTTAPSGTTSGTDQPVATPPPVSTTLPIDTRQAVLAFDDDGQASQIISGQSSATPLFRFENLNDSWEMFDVAYSRDVAFIGTCCEPATGAVYEVDGATSGSPSLVEPSEAGYGVSVSPSEDFVAYGSFADNPVTIKDLRSDAWIDSPPAPGWADIAIGEYTPADIVWLDDRRMLALGVQTTADGDGDPEYVLYDITIDDGGQIASVSGPISTGQISDLERPFQFAGRPDAEHVALHQLGSDQALIFDLASLSQTGTTTIGDQPYRSAWFDLGDGLTTVDNNGVLSIAGTVIDGTFVWARTT